VVECQQIIVERVRGGPGAGIRNLSEPGFDRTERDRRQSRARQQHAERIDVDANRAATQDRGLDRGRAAPHERIINGVPGLGQTIDEEPRKLRLEARAVADFMDPPGLPLPRGPEFVHVIGEVVVAENFCFRAELAKICNKFNEPPGLARGLGRI